MRDRSTDAPRSSGRGVTVGDIKLRFMEDGHDGLIAWASCVLNGTVVLNNIAVRRGRNGGLYLSYPAKVSATGAKITLFHPISAEAAAVLQAAIVGRVRELIGFAAETTSKGTD